MKKSNKFVAKCMLLLSLALASAPIITGCDLDYSSYKHGKSTWFSWNDR